MRPAKGRGCQEEGALALYLHKLALWTSSSPSNEEQLPYPSPVEEKKPHCGVHQGSREKAGPLYPLPLLPPLPWRSSPTLCVLRKSAEALPRQG